MFTINSYRSTGPRRAGKISRISDKIDRLEAKDELTGKQAAKLDRLEAKLDRITPEDEVLVRYDGKTLGVTIVDSVYDDIIDGSETLRFVLRGEKENGSSWRTFLWLNHPEKTNDKYDMDANLTVSVDGVNHTTEYDRNWLEVYANDTLVFTQDI